MDLFQFLPQGRGFLRHMSHVTLGSCHSMLALYCLSTQRHMALKLAQRGCFSCRVNSALLVMRSTSPLPTSIQRECCTVSGFKMKPLLQPMGKNGSNPATNITPCHSQSIESFSSSEVFKGKIFLLCFVLLCFDLGQALKWHGGWCGKQMHSMVCANENEDS